MPAVIGLAVTPLLLYKLLPPEVQQTPEAPAQAAEKLDKMGSMSRNETIMLGTMCFALVLWVRAEFICRNWLCISRTERLATRQTAGNSAGDLLAKRFANASHCGPGLACSPLLECAQALAILAAGNSSVLM